ncbi:MAG: hypothetical protein NTX56_08370 [Proteobacteria bacterium]|nr:hypothetical protein [Pseudomonadota bacterium]
MASEPGPLDVAMGVGGGGAGGAAVGSLAGLDTAVVTEMTSLATAA